MQLFIRDKSFYKLLMALALPIALQGLITFGVSLMDTVMLGALGEVSLSGAALANQFCFIFLVLNFGLGGGAGVLTAQFWGKRDSESIAKTMSIVLKITTLLGLLFFLLAQVFPQRIMSFYTTEPEVILQGSRYLRIISISFVFQGVSTITAILLRSVGVVKLMLITTSITFLNNIFFNWVFIFGNLGAPRLETAGAALATMISRLLEFGVIIFFLLVIDKKIQFRLPALFKHDKAIFNRYLNHGTPVLISDLFLVLGMNMLAVIMGRMGSEMVAANAITGVVWQLTAIFLMGTANASGVITGNIVGAEDYEKAQSFAVTFVALSFIMGLCAGIAIFFLKYTAVNFYNITEETRAITYQLMNAMVLISGFSAMSFTLTKGVLRAGGDTRFLMLADVLFLWIVSVPLGFLAGLVFKWPPGIVLLCLKIDEVIKSLWCVGRLLSKKWIKNVTHQTEETTVQPLETPVVVNT